MDADGPLARLKKAIFNPELYENIADWIVVSVLVQTYSVNVTTLSHGDTDKHRSNFLCGCCMV